MTNIKHASDNTHTQENGAHYFHKLRKLQDKILRYSTHLDTYQKHITAGTTPKGLRIHTTPCLGNLPMDLRTKWDNTISNTTREFLNILGEQCKRVITQIENEYSDIIRTRNPSQNKLEILHRIQSKTKLKLIKKQNKKFTNI